MSQFTLTRWFTGHGTVLFVIISIETSIGIVCGSLPGCKPLFTKLFPFIFVPTNNTNSYELSHSKKPQYPNGKSADGQLFPFQIVEERAFEVRSETSKAHTDEDRDDIASENSREWIMTQGNLKDERSPV
jgi:hypothetical protein